MTFTSASEPSAPADRRILLEVDQLTLSFTTDVYRPWTWRESVSRLFSNPGISAGLPSGRDHLQVLDGLNLTVREGDRIGLVGANGTGKTTLCKCIAGFYRPASGTIKAHGSVRAVFDTGFGIQPELTGRENAELLSQFIFPLDVDRQRLVDEALEFSELGKFLDMPFRLYSNGMQARLCLSLISGKGVDLLILDEVFEGADAYFRKKISRRILQMIEESGAVIFVSHAAEQVRTVCNRLIVLQHGKVGYDGPVESGLEHYESAIIRA